jgi:hypothetical protein
MTVQEFLHYLMTTTTAEIDVVYKLREFYNDEKNRGAMADNEFDEVCVRLATLRSVCTDIWNLTVTLEHHFLPEKLHTSRVPAKPKQTKQEAALETLCKLTGLTPAKLAEFLANKNRVAPAK